MATCSVKWCVALSSTGGTECAVHAKRGIGFRIGQVGTPSPHCDECDGTRTCLDCDGEGEHNCEHPNCYESHECQTCDGTGECAYCEDDHDGKDSFDTDYIAFAFDAGLMPLPPLYSNPWESASDVN